MIEFKDIILEDKRVVVNCRTQQEANNLLAWAHSKGKKWCNGESYINNTNWEMNKDLTCYGLWFGEYGNRIDFSTTHLRCIFSYKDSIKW